VEVSEATADSRSRTSRTFGLASIHDRTVVKVYLLAHGVPGIAGVGVAQTMRHERGPTMLVLTRKINGKHVVVGGSGVIEAFMIRSRFLEIRNGSVRMGFEPTALFPSIAGEVWERIRAGEQPDSPPAEPRETVLSDVQGRSSTWPPHDLMKESMMVRRDKPNKCVLNSAPHVHEAIGEQPEERMGPLRSGAAGVCSTPSARTGTGVGRGIACRRWRFGLVCWGVWRWRTSSAWRLVFLVGISQSVAPALPFRLDGPIRPLILRICYRTPWEMPTSAAMRTQMIRGDSQVEESDTTRGS